MTEQPSLATVIPFRKSKHIDVEAPFRRFRQAGLVNAQFAIDGRDLFWGYHDPNRRWNGWATPGFIREVAELIADWVNGDEPGSTWWEGETLHVRGGDGTYVEEVDPDRLGLYRFDGWIWLESDG